MVSIYEASILDRICHVLGATSEGLTGSEIGRILSDLAIPDPAPGMTKRRRLYEALRQRQAADGHGNSVAQFIERAMTPVLYTGSGGQFERRRRELNEVLAFSGAALCEDGKLRPVAQARNLTEAESRAGRLRTELQRRQVHADVIVFCRTEIMDSNYFHAVLEATKSICEKIRSRTGLTGDGAALVDAAFGLGSGIPFLAFNRLESDTEKSEHSGIMNLLKGTLAAFRNPIAHAPKTTWLISEQDALDLLTIASYLHRRLDAAFRTPRQP